MSNDAAVAAYITSLSREEARYAAAYAHWLSHGVPVATREAETRRKPVRTRRAAAIRQQLDTRYFKGAVGIFDEPQHCTCQPGCQRWLPCDCACHEPELGEQ